MSRTRATIRDVAAAAGVSLATASRALNQSGPVSAATAAAWLIEAGLPELCDCSRPIALISHSGPAASPMRKPVIA